MTQFEIQALSQHWLLPDDSDGDLCSHGTIRLIIGEQTIVDGEEEYGLSTSALALLRTLERDHTHSAPVADRLLMHGCGLILMRGCPIGVNWSVVHSRGRVALANVERFETTAAAPTRRYAVDITIPFEEYRQQVLSFAQQVRTFFDDSRPRVLPDKFDQEQFHDFWSEYLQILKRSEAA